LPAIAADLEIQIRYFHRNQNKDPACPGAKIMAKEYLIRFFRGNLAAMPVLADGEPAFALDTKTLYVGDGGVNQPIGYARISAGNYGDITVDVLGTTWTVNNGVITAAKLAAITSHRLLGRKAATDGTAQEVSIDELFLWLTPSIGDVFSWNGSSVTKSSPSRVGDVLQSEIVGGLGLPKFVSKGYILLAEIQTAGTQGGTFTSGAWRTRTLNTEVMDTAGDCSLSANQFTLAAGTYELLASAPGAAVNSHATRLQDVTSGLTIANGSTEFAGSGVQSNSLISTRFTVAAGKALEIQHQCQTTVATLGFGIGIAFAPSQFTTVTIHRVA
jgi:hypothetical protein